MKSFKNVAGKILRSAEMEYKIAESELSLLLMSRNTVVNSCCYHKHSAIKVIEVLT